MKNPLKNNSQEREWKQMSADEEIRRAMREARAHPSSFAGNVARMGDQSSDPTDPVIGIMPLLAARKEQHNE